MRDDRDHADARPESEQRGHDRERHRQQRPEAQQQDNHRCDDRDPRRCPDARAHGLLDRRSIELDLEPRRVDRPSHTNYAIDRTHGQPIALLIERDRREPDRAARQNVPSTGRVRADHARHVRQPGYPRQHCLDRRPHRRSPQLTCAGTEHDLVRVTGLRREPRAQQIARALRAGTRQTGAVAEWLPTPIDRPPSDPTSTTSHTPSTTRRCIIDQRATDSIIPTNSFTLRGAAQAGHIRSHHLRQDKGPCCDTPRRCCQETVRNWLCRRRNERASARGCGSRPPAGPELNRVAGTCSRSASYTP
jgi:hypothetical protein